jgi:hypothetical protein
MRKSLWIMLAVLILAVAAPMAHADTFSFSFSNTIGNTPGTVTGTLTFTGTGTFTGQAATAITLTSTPSAYTSQLPISDFTVSEIANSFSAVGGVITAANLNLEWTDGTTFTDTLGLQSTVGNANALLTGPVPTGFPFTATTENIDGLSGVTFTDISTVPEPSSVALMLLGVGLLLVLRKRIGQGLPQAS